MIVPTENDLIALSGLNFEQFRSQLAKDFESAALDATFCQNLIGDYTSIVESVRVELVRISSGSTEKLANLLYCVDVKEADTRQWQDIYNISFVEALAHLIVRRELQKIWFKHKFSNK